MRNQAWNSSHGPRIVRASKGNDPRLRSLHAQVRLNGYPRVVYIEDDLGLIHQMIEKTGPGNPLI